MKRIQAFTFIEIMIAIAVFSIGVLAVLRLVTQNLVSMDRTETRTIATFLAKEGLELTYNIRDANLQKGLPWNCVLLDKVESNVMISNEIDACAWFFSSGTTDGNVLTLGFAATGYFIAQAEPLKSNFTENFKAFMLSAMTGNVGDSEFSRYGLEGKEGAGDATFFARYISFSNVKEDMTVLPATDILKIESHVLFIKGATTGEIILESFIGSQ